MPPFLTTQIHLYSFLMQHERPLKILERKTQLLSKGRNMMQTWLVPKNLLPRRHGLFLPSDLSKHRTCCLAACCRWTTSARSAPVQRDFILCSYHIAFVPTRGEERVTGVTGSGVFSPTTLAMVGGACAAPAFSRNCLKFLYRDNLISFGWQRAERHQTPMAGSSWQSRGR